MSWYPLGHGDKSLINEPVFAELGKKYGKSSAQIILRWHTQMGFVVIPGSKNVDHIKDNLDILDFKLTDEEMEEIAKLDVSEFDLPDVMCDSFLKFMDEMSERRYKRREKKESILGEI